MIGKIDIVEVLKGMWVTKVKNVHCQSAFWASDFCTCPKS